MTVKIVTPIETDESRRGLFGVWDYLTQNAPKEGWVFAFGTWMRADPAPKQKTKSK